jgi:hypothetical protein
MNEVDNISGKQYFNNVFTVAAFRMWIEKYLAMTDFFISRKDSTNSLDNMFEIKIPSMSHLKYTINIMLKIAISVAVNNPHKMNNFVCPSPLTICI